jgi:hypothetical protein
MYSFSHYPPIVLVSHQDGPPRIFGPHALVWSPTLDRTDGVANRILWR